LGWSPGDDREVLSRQELVAAFSLDKISGGNAVFNTEKLDWMNAQYIARMPVEELARQLHPLFEDAGLAESSVARDPGAFRRLVELIRPRAKRLTDFIEQGRPIVVSTVAYEEAALEK